MEKRSKSNMRSSLPMRRMRKPTKHHSFRYHRVQQKIKTSIFQFYNVKGKPNQQQNICKKYLSKPTKIKFTCTGQAVAALPLNAAQRKSQSSYSSLRKSLTNQFAADYSVGMVRIMTYITLKTYFIKYNDFFLRKIIYH